MRTDQKIIETGKIVAKNVINCLRNEIVSSIFDFEKLDKSQKLGLILVSCRKTLDGLVEVLKEAGVTGHDIKIILTEYAENLP